jgi:sodium transport system permease protein
MMDVRHIIHVFAKDGLEILRDRRTLFVNIVLPALLYPFIALFMIQVLQITKSQHIDPPRLALLDGAEELAPFLERSERTHPRPATTPLPGMAPAGDARAHLSLVTLPAAVAQRLRTYAHDLDAVSHIERHDQSPGVQAQQRQLRHAVLQILRENDLACLVVSNPASSGPKRLLVLEDEAHLHADIADQAVSDALDALRHALVLARLAEVGLNESALRPVSIDTVGLAPPAETVRMRMAGFIPLLLVIMAAVGAFYPALDLIAGERERGTLENLLAWPVARRDIFLGKLLVTCCAAGASVVLNLLSLALTIALAGHQLAAAGGDFSGALSAGAGTLVLSFIALVPITVTLGALSLSLAGLAASAKEAQNYLTPLLLVVMVAALVAAVPDTRANLVLDLVPITGSVLALKESLQSHGLPWLHLALSTAASVALAAVVVSWASRLLESERFCYPGLVRAGWGRFRRWGAGQALPSGLEVMAVYALAVGGMTYGGSLFSDASAPLMIVGPLIVFILLPPLVHAWIGAYAVRDLLQLHRPSSGTLLRGLVAVPFAIMASSAIGALQPEMPSELNTGTEDLLTKLASAGTAIELLCVAVAPALCEEVLCRGTLLSGLRRSVGDGGGVVLTAFLFATLHLSPYRFLPQFTLGIALALLTIRARSIFPSMLMHAGHNAGIWLLASNSALLERLPGVALIADLPPLALLAIGLAGLSLSLGFPRPQPRE